MTEKTLWRYTDVARYHRVCLRTVYRMRRSGELPKPVIDKPGRVRFDPDEVRSHINKPRENFSGDNRCQSVTNGK